MYSKLAYNQSKHWDTEQKWDSYIIDQTWTGKLVDKQLLLNVSYPSGLKKDHMYFYINFDTCPLQGLN